MLLKDFVKPVQNSTNKQKSLVLKKREFKKFGLDPNTLLNMPVPKEYLKPTPKRFTNPKLTNLLNNIQNDNN